MLPRYFEHPGWLLLCIAAMLVLAAMVWRARKLCQLRSAKLGVVPTSWPWPRGLMLLTAAILLAIAASGPRVGGSALAATAAGCDVAIVLDASRSMSAKDEMPDRLGRAREIITQIVQSLEKQGGHRAAVIAFAGKPLMLAPLTYDMNFIRSALAEFDPAEVRLPIPGGVSGTRIGAGLQSAIDALAAGRQNAGMILLVSDGDDPLNDREYLSGAAQAEAARIPVGVIGVGKTDRDAGIPQRPTLTRQRSDILAEIAERGRGRYLDGSWDGADVVGHVRAMMHDLPRGDAAELALARVPGRAAPFLAVGLVCLAAGLVGWNWRAATATAAIAAVAAGPIDDWLRRGDAALAAGRPEQALQWYDRAETRTDDPGLVAFNQGVALAALGRHREAELHFRWCLSDATGPRKQQALYNIGTCLTHRRDRAALTAAISTFEEALKIIPADNPLANRARENLEIAQSLLAKAPANDPNAPGDSGTDTASNNGKPSDTAPRPGSAKPDGSATNAESTDQPGSAGKGTLPPLADADALDSMTPEDLAEHLRKAMERIAAARRDRLKAKEAERTPNYPDW